VIARDRVIAVIGKPCKSI